MTDLRIEDFTYQITTEDAEANKQALEDQRRETLVEYHGLRVPIAEVSAIEEQQAISQNASRGGFVKSVKRYQGGVPRSVCVVIGLFIVGILLAVLEVV